MAGNVTPKEAHELMAKEGYAYLDVRTVGEFDAGHPAGAWNVPLLIDGPGGRGPNAAFMEGATRAFPDRASKLVVGCLAGGRAARAAGMLEGAGYTNVIVQAAGWGGLADSFGRVTQPGWKAEGLPTATTAEPGRSWAELAAHR
jgi:rhodanese-related sulfurtransferase